MFGLGAPEIIIILIVLVVFLFGGKKIVGFARSLGKFSGEFKKGKMEVDKEVDKVKKEINK